MFFISNLHNDAEATNNTSFASLVMVAYMSDWLKMAFQKTVYVRAIKVALVVGTILVLINHGDTLLQGAFAAKTLFQMALTYLVPYAVSTYASVETIRNTK
jgi:hypothetical protein